MMQPAHDNERAPPALSAPGLRGVAAAPCVRKPAVPLKLGEMHVLPGAVVPAGYQRSKVTNTPCEQCGISINALCSKVTNKGM